MTNVENIKVEERKSNFELLRIVSIFLIIVFHYVFKSGYEFESNSLHNYILKIFYFFGELGVNSFILLTGYFMIKRNISIKKIICICFETFFYCQINVFLIMYITKNKFDFIHFPIIYGQYWFITAYILIYILSPFFNKFIMFISKKDFQKLLGISIIIWCIIPTFYGIIYNSTESLLFYSRFIWLTIMYFIGAYIRLYDIKVFQKKSIILSTILITFLLMILSITVNSYLSQKTILFYKIETAYLWTPNNILMLLLSIAFFMFFSKINIKKNKIINLLASTTLGIYMLHDGMFSGFLWKEVFHSKESLESNCFIFYILGTSFLVFIIGALVDLLRQYIEKYTIKKLISISIWKTMYQKLICNANSIVDKYI